MENSLIFFLALKILLMLALPAKGQNQKFDQDDKRKIFLKFSPEDSIFPSPYIFVKKGNKKTDSLCTLSRTTKDSIYLLLDKNIKICEILKAYGDTLVIELGCLGKNPCFVFMVFKDNKLGFKKKFLQLLIKQDQLLLVSKYFLCTKNTSKHWQADLKN